MKMHSSTIALRTCLLVGLMSVLSCRERDVPADVPACVRATIDQLQQGPVRNPPGSVYRYSYKGQTVYYIPPYCCDNPSILMD